MRLKITLWFLVFVLSFPVISQTIIWEEDFKTNQGWFIGENWIVDESKLQFTWSPQITNFDAFTISPIVYLDENVEDLIVTQYLDVFSGQPDETAEIIVVLDDDEVVLWSHVLENGNWGDQSGTDLSLPLSEFAGQNVRFKIRAYGSDSFNWNWWAVFEMKVTAHFDYDLAITSIAGQHLTEVSESGLWSIDIINLGGNSNSDFTVNLFCYNTGTLIGSVSDPETLSSMQTKSYVFEWTADYAYNTVFYGVIESENDEFVGNNGSDSYFVRIEPDLDYNILVWDNDNGIQTVIDPDKGDIIRPAEGLTRVLDNAGLEYSEFTYLPENLDDYDIVFATMGCFCVD